MSIRYFNALFPIFAALILSSRADEPSCRGRDFDCDYQWSIYDGSRMPPTYTRIYGLVENKNGIDRLDYLFRKTRISDSNTNTMIRVAQVYSERYGKENVCRHPVFSNALNYLSESAGANAAPYVKEDLKDIVCRHS